MTVWFRLLHLVLGIALVVDALARSGVQPWEAMAGGLLVSQATWPRLGREA